MKQLWKKMGFVLGVILISCIWLTPVVYGAQQLADDSYFDDVVFVGDSISLKLRNYINKQRKDDPAFFGDAQFLTAGGLGSGNVQLPIDAKSLHPAYGGKKMYLENSIAATGAKKAYIMFGMNDIVPYGVEGAQENLEQLIDKILDKTPALEIVVQSVTPMLTNRQQRNLNNANIEAYNARLQEMCVRRGFTFLDTALVLRDSDGGLIQEYCGDASGLGLHLSDAGCASWIEFLRATPANGNKKGRSQSERENAVLTEDGDSPIFVDFGEKDITYDREQEEPKPIANVNTENRKSEKKSDNRVNSGRLFGSKN